MIEQFTSLVRNIRIAINSVAQTGGDVADWLWILGSAVASFVSLWAIVWFAIQLWAALKTILAPDPETRKDADARETRAEEREAEAGKERESIYHEAQDGRTAAQATRDGVDELKAGQAEQNAKQAELEAKIDQLLAREQKIAHKQGREFGPDAQAQFERQVREILSSSDARKLPAQEALKDQRTQDAADHLMKVAAQEGAAADDIAKSSAATYREAGALYLAENPQKALEAYREAARLDGTDFWTWIELSRLEDKQAGNLPTALTAAKRAQATAATPRERSVALSHQGNLSIKAGKLDQAIENHNAAMTIAEAIARENPTSAQARRDLSVSHNKLGDAFMQAGKLDQTIENYNAAMTIAEAIARENPTSAQARRDLFISHNNLGDAFMQARKLDQTIENCNAAMTIAEAIARENPASAEARRDLSISHNKLGDAFMQAGKLDQAIENYNAAMTIVEAIARENPASAEAQRDVLASCQRLADATSDNSWWQKALPIVEDMSERGQLAPVDEWILDMVRTKAAGG